MSDDSWDSPAALAQLRALAAADAPADGVPPVLLGDDALVRRFLRARRGEPKAALAMLREHALWRSASCGEWWPRANVPLELVRAQAATGKAYCRGFDRRGRPAAWVRVRLHLATTSRPDIHNFVIFLIDEVVARCDEAGVEQAVVVIDFHGFGMANYDIDAASFLMRMLSSNFPERLGRLLFVRESMLFIMAWRIIKLFVDARTAEKITFLGSNFREALLNEFDDAEIPHWLGGRSDYTFAAEDVASYVTLRREGASSVSAASAEALASR